MDNSIKNLIDGEAQLDDEEDDESFDEETGDVNPRTNKGAELEDSSEEDEDDDDEEEARRVCQNPYPTTALMLLETLELTALPDPRRIHRRRG
jgi:hypothetical protein